MTEQFNGITLYNSQTLVDINLEGISLLTLISTSNWVVAEEDYHNHNVYIKYKFSSKYIQLNSLIVSPIY